MDKERFIVVCNEAAEKLGVPVGIFKWEVYEEVKKQCDEEDIVSWLEDNGYEATAEFVKKIAVVYRDKYDCDMGTWDNIESAYKYVKGD